MSSHVVGLFNHAAPVTATGNFQLCLLVGYGEDRIRKKDGVYFTPEKRNYVYSDDQM